MINLPVNAICEYLNEIKISCQDFYIRLRLPHLDTVYPVLCRLPEAELEPLKHTLVKTLLEEKALHQYRLFGRTSVSGKGLLGPLLKLLVA